MTIDPICIPELILRVSLIFRLKTLDASFKVQKQCGWILGEVVLSLSNCDIGVSECSPAAQIAVLRPCQPMNSHNVLLKGSAIALSALPRC